MIGRIHNKLKIAVGAAMAAPAFAGESDLAAAISLLNSGENLNLNPVAELLKLVTAAAIGYAVTRVERSMKPEGTPATTAEQSQILLCVCGALMMIIIGNSLARALGLAGGAAIIRFRTPVKDPRVSAVMFLLMGLGMACGMGMIPLAALGAVFVAALLRVMGPGVGHKQAPMSFRTSEGMKTVPSVTECRTSEPSRDRQGATVGRPEPATSSPRIIFDGAAAAPRSVTTSVEGATPCTSRL